MANEIFLIALTAIFMMLLRWGFKTLPGENWQIIASVPVSRDVSGRWRGINLTYYGLLSANAYIAAISILLILMGTLKVPLIGVFTTIVTILLICVPASRFIARIVEKKSHTFTIGGASFLGILIAPWVLSFINTTVGAKMGYSIPPIPALAAFIISYAFGEGMGRLACISFGCCYGKPLSRSHNLIQRLFHNYCFMFSGKTKKIAYESGLDGVKVIPIQAITAVLYITTGIFGTFLFLESYYSTAFIMTMVVTQAWRSFSEVLRADYRGGGRISIYQIMAIIAIGYSLGIIPFLPSTPAIEAGITVGLLSLWSPAVIFFSLGLWFAIFLYTGRSTVTGSTVTFHVHKDRI